MKAVRIYATFSLMVACLLNMAAQDAGKSNSVTPPNPISISFETGRYDIEPNCKNEAIGCLPRAWTPTREFKSGSSVWIKITVVNHSNQVAVNNFPEEYPPFVIGVIENASGKAPNRTRWSCWMRPSSCPPPVEKLPPVEVHDTYWEIPPGKSQSSILEVTREFEITNPGEYTVSVETMGFELTTAENTTHGMYRDRNLVKHIGAFKADEVRFVVVKQASEK
jgi:hypothetical protein